MPEKPIITNLSVRLPNVLFLGNGLFYNEDFSWLNLITKVAKNEKNIPELKGNEDVFKVPNTVLSFALFDTDDNKRHDKYIKALSKYKYFENENIKKLLELPFDAILTTNYTYDIEYAIDSNYPKLSDSTKSKKAFYTAKDSKYLIHSYNQIGDSIPIWHIHGEMRRKSSMILAHDEYARLVERILNYNTQRRNSYQLYYKKLKIKSWIDFFILGNLYFLGYSLDFSEFDIWWLLGRRLREKAPIGNVYFYEPLSQENKYKHRALGLVGVNVKTLGFEKKDETDIYSKFYSSAVEDIKNKLLM